MDQVSERALQVKNDPSLEDSFIKEHHKFLVKNIWHVTHRFVTKQDDEYAIAMIAFHEAVTSYDETAGPFEPFAALVIRRRVTDFLRTEIRHAAEISADPETMNAGYADRENEEDTGNSAIVRRVGEVSTQTYVESQRQKDLALEIEEATELLQSYGFSFYDLTECSPKSLKTRDACQRAIIALLRPGELFEELKRTGNVPMRKLSLASGISAKILERHRRYIIASAEILAGDFPLLADYLDYVRKELRQ